MRAAVRALVRRVARDDGVRDPSLSEQPPLPRDADQAEHTARRRQGADDEWNGQGDCRARRAAERIDLRRSGKVPHADRRAHLQPPAESVTHANPVLERASVHRKPVGHPVPIVEIEIKKPGNPSLMPTALDPVKLDPKHYKVEFENDQVRVLRVTIGPHESTPVHQHPVNRVVTYLTDQDFRVTSPNGKVETVKHNVGEVVWSGPATHKEENMSNKPFEVVVTEIKN